MDLFEVNDFDRDFYSKNIRDFLPDKIVDIHCHIYLKKDKNVFNRTQSRAVTWPLKVAEDNSVEDLNETYSLFFPDKQVTPLFFPDATQNDDLDAMNEYTAQSAKKTGAYALLFASPEWSAAYTEKLLDKYPYKGLKVYLELSPPYIPEDEIRIFDFLTPKMLEIANRRKLIVMLHIPRKDRLKDALNIAQIQQICKAYPDIKLILAHVGRAYCESDIGEALDILKKEEKLLFDFSANSNAAVFEKLIRAVGTERILFGSDLPVLRMRTRRIDENGRYVNLIQKGAYGDVSDDSHMREVTDERFTFFMYREIEAMKIAARKTGLTRNDIEKMFFKNGRILLDEAGVI